MAKLTWIKSYETYKFDTVDGDLHQNQYAKLTTTDPITLVQTTVHFVRVKSESETQFECLEARDDAATLDIPAIIAGMTEVHIIPGEHNYYDEFMLPDGTKYRKKSDKIKYTDLAKKDALPREKTVTNKELDDIAKEKIKWQ